MTYLQWGGSARTARTLTWKPCSRLWRPWGVGPGSGCSSSVLAGRPPLSPASPQKSAFVLERGARFSLRLTWVFTRSLTIPGRGANLVSKRFSTWPLASLSGVSSWSGGRYRDPGTTNFEAMSNEQWARGLTCLLQAPDLPGPWEPPGGVRGIELHGWTIGRGNGCGLAGGRERLTPVRPLASRSKPTNDHRSPPPDLPQFRLCNRRRGGVSGAALRARLGPAGGASGSPHL